MEDLTNNSKLQIIIVPSDQNYPSPTGEDITGKLIFREGSNTIEVNGHSYKATSSNDLTAIINALKNTGYLTQGENNILTANNPGTVAALLGTKIATASGEGVDTVSGWITSLQSSISGINSSISTINTNITNLQTATNSKIANVTGYKEGTIADDLISVIVDSNHVANIKSTQNLINAIAKANAAFPKGTSTHTDAATLEQAIIGTGTISESTTILNPNEGDNNVWLLNEEKTLTHLKELINKLGGEDLSAVQAAIDDIKKELIDPANTEQTTTLSTILDHLKILYGGTTEQSFSVNGGTQKTLAGIISALETEINTVDAKAGKHSVVTDGVEDNATAGTTNYAVVTSSELNGQTTYTVKTTSALDTVATNAANALSTANAALPKGSGGSYANAAALESGLKGYADNVATTRANSVISWEVIGENNSTGS